MLIAAVVVFSCPQAIDTHAASADGEALLATCHVACPVDPPVWTTSRRFPITASIWFSRSGLFALSWDRIGLLAGLASARSRDRLDLSKAG